MSQAAPKCRSLPCRIVFIPDQSVFIHLSLRCSELPKPLSIAPSIGFSSMKSTTTRMMVIASSILMILFPSVFRLSAPGTVLFFLHSLRAEEDKGKPDVENTLH